MQSELIIIVAMGRDGAIGLGNQLLCHLPEDLQHFKRQTMGHHLIMGRRTYDSIGRPLPGRTSVVLSRGPALPVQPGLIQVGSWDEALAQCQGEARIFVAGGAQVYAQAIGRAQRIILTRMDRDFPGADAFFPAIDPAIWQLEKTGDWLESKAGIRFKMEEYTHR